MPDMCGWGLGIWHHLQHQPWLDRILPRNLGQVEISASWRSHLCPRVPRKVWNYLLTVSEVFYNKQTMPGMYGWGLGYSITCNISLDWIGHYPENCAQVEISASRRSHLCPRVPRKVWNYLITVSEVFHDTQTMSDRRDEVWEWGITCNINLDWVGHYLGIWSQIEISAPWRSHLHPRVPRKVWNYLITVPEVFYDT